MNQKNQSLRLWLVGLLLCGITVAVFWPVFYSDFLNFDDPDYVTDNRFVKAGLTAEGVSWSFTTGHAGNWHPVTWLSHMADVSLFGMRSPAHHAMNLGFHLANGCLLLVLLHRMTGALWRSFFVAALFAVHPFHVESVAWVSERKDVLSTFFGLLSLIAYVRYSTKQSIASVHPASCILHPLRSFDYWLALVLLAFGLMSKAMLVTWPFVMLLMDFWPLKRMEFSTLNFASPSSAAKSDQLSTLRRLAMEKIPFFLVVLASCVVTFIVQRQGGAVSTAGNLPLELRVANAVVSYCKYLGKCFWPDNLAVFYPHPELRYPISEQWPAWGIVLAALALVGITIFVWRRRSSHPYLPMGWFWFLGTLVPVIGIVQVGTQAMADRYTYVPLMGMFILVVWGAATICERRRSIALFVAATAVCACSVLSWSQARIWKDDRTLFAHALNSTRNNALAHLMLGKALWKEEKKEEAFQHFQTALDLSPFQQGIHNDMAVALYSRGEPRKAIENFEAELSLRPFFFPSHFGLASIYAAQGEWEMALPHYEEVIRYKPDHSGAHDGIGFVLFELGRLAEAERHFREALKLNPGNIDSMADLGRVLAVQGRHAEAEAMLRTVVNDKSKPEFQAVYANVLYDLGQTNEATKLFTNAVKMQSDLFASFLRQGDALLAQNSPEAACFYFEVAVRLDASSSEAAGRLGSVLAALGRLDEAAASFEVSDRLRPDANVQYRLGLVRLIQGKPVEARAAFENAIKLAPQWDVALNELAWLLATHRNDAIRDGVRAVALAEKACELSGGNEARFWGTLDAAYAEAGRFDDAIRTAAKAQEMASSSENKQVADAANVRLGLYRQGKPFRQ